MTAEAERLAVYEREREELAAAIVKAVQGQYIGKPPPLLTGWQERAVSAVLAAGWLPPAAVQERVEACQPTATNDQTGSSEPPDDVVEAVARAICNAGRDYDRWASDKLGHLEREDLRVEARAAIAAMPKPAVTPEQVEQAALFMFAVRTYNHRRADYARKCWELTIDEDDREAWRRTARDLLAFAGVTVEDGDG